MCSEKTRQAVGLKIFFPFWDVDQLILDLGKAGTKLNPPNAVGETLR